MVVIPVSIGELFDKISILEIKLDKITDPEKLKIVKKELRILEKIRHILPFKNPIEFASLKIINLSLWDIEDTLRKIEKECKFDDKFIYLARSVYKLNDQRSMIKGTINKIYNSEIKETKSYEEY